MEWVRPDRAIKLLVESISPQQRLVFEAMCCGRIGRLLTDRRASRALALLIRLAKNENVTAELLAIESEIRAAALGAFFERHDAEAICEFAPDAAYWYARACERAVYAVGALFEYAFAEVSETILPKISAASGAAHFHASQAVLHEVQATILLAYEDGEGYSPSNKVARAAGRWASWSEEAEQLKLLRAVSGGSVAYAEQAAAPGSRKLC